MANITNSESTALTTAASTVAETKDKLVTAEALKLVNDSLKTDIRGKLDKKQGVVNAGKFLKVGVTGDIECSDAPSGGGGSTADIESHNASNIAHQDIRNELKNKADVSQIPSIGGLATKTELSGKADKSTTLSGYGITDGATKTELNNKADKAEVGKLKEDLTNHRASKHFDGDYANLTNKPTIPDISGLATKAELSNKADKSAIPTKLPNPQPIKFTGGVVAEYDGSGAVTVQIPSGSGSGAVDPQDIEKAVNDYMTKNPPSVTDKSITPQKTDFLRYESVAKFVPKNEANGYLGILTELLDCTKHDFVFLKTTGAILDFVQYCNPTGTVEIKETNEDYRFLLKQWYDANAVRYSIYKIPTKQKHVRVRLANFNDASSYEMAFEENGFNESHVFEWDKYGMPNFKDGSIPLEKTDMLEQKKDNNLINPYRLGEVTQLGSEEDVMFGYGYRYFLDFVDVTKQKVIYHKYLSNSTDTVIRKPLIACFDSAKTYMYTLNKTEGHDMTPVLINCTSSVGKSIFVGNEKAGSVNVQRYEIPADVSYIKIACFRPQANVTWEFYKQEIISYTDIKNPMVDTSKPALTMTQKFKKMLNEAEQKTMLMIGDSLTNWCGGNAVEKGFLKIVYDETGVLPKNEGTAGAWWQTGVNQGFSAVNRVNTLIAEKRKYDLYCFMLGTNAGSPTDTGETSNDTSTMCGAIRYCMEKLKAYDPTGTILVCLPPQRQEGNETQEKINEVIKKIVESYGIRTVDMYHNSGIVPNTKIAGANYLNDGLHLGDIGIEAVGKLLASEVKYLLRI